MYRICHNPLVHPIFKESFKYSFQEEYLATRSDSQYYLFPLSTDILACQASNGQFYHNNSPLYTEDTSSPCGYALFLQDKERINKFFTLSVINQTQDETFIINDDFLEFPSFRVIKSYT